MGGSTLKIKRNTHIAALFFVTWMKLLIEESEMKKLILFILSISLLIVGCASQPKPSKFPGAPKWWTKRPIDKTIIYGVGTALRPLPNLSEQVATMRARQIIAGQLEEKVVQTLDDVQEAAGVGLTADVIEYNKTVGSAIRNNALKLSTIDKTAWGKDGRCYVLVSYDMDKAINMAKKVAKEEKIKYNNIKSKLEGQAYIDALDERMKALQGYTSVHPAQD